ncbi:hypothetical protein EUGRSUZ_C00767 [Eucalyptus grandis]|uniref:Uncharacterized protein n=2 Tax=Eucalyptus grandis TaxID=71139 RepID=A0ACC3LCQ5_EUCGR|nr:hypothetical protein EUGRSUZ_C00767 [Eucalyptus grandis]
MNPHYHRNPYLQKWKLHRHSHISHSPRKTQWSADLPQHHRLLIFSFNKFPTTLHDPLNAHLITNSRLGVPEYLCRVLVFDQIAVKSAANFVTLLMQVDMYNAACVWWGLAICLTPSTQSRDRMLPLLALSKQ